MRVVFRMRSAGEVHPWQEGELLEASAHCRVRDEKGGELRPYYKDVFLSVADCLEDPRFVGSVWATLGGQVL